MDETQIEATLDAAERAVATGTPVGQAGFWKVVGAVKGDPGLVERYADRIARIDRAALKGWALVTVPLWLGNMLMIGGSLIGLVLVAWAYSLEGNVAGVVFLLGFGVVLVTTHSLGHLVTGALMGIRFTHWFIGSMSQPQPGVKVDYASYLRAPPASRAWMHASGALVTKIVPFALLGAAFAADVPTWTVVVLIVVGIGQVLTDVIWSTKASDWKKFRREMGFAQSGS